jgi:hypothetical protein
MQKINNSNTEIKDTTYLYGGSPPSLLDAYGPGLNPMYRQ